MFTVVIFPSATSDGTSDSLSKHEGGHCMSSNMKMAIYICNGSSGKNAFLISRVTISEDICFSQKSTVTRANFKDRFALKYHKDCFIHVSCFALFRRSRG